MKKRAFVRYSKKGKIVPGSLIITNGSFPNGPSTWREVSADICCNDNFRIGQIVYGDWTVVTGGEAGDGVVLMDEASRNDFTIIGPNDDEDTGWVYIKQYFPTGAEMSIDYEWACFDGGTTYDRPVYWTSATQPNGIPDDITAKVGSSPADGTWSITINPGEWFAVGIYSTDSCCGRGFLQLQID